VSRARPWFFAGRWDAALAEIEAGRQPADPLGCQRRLNLGRLAPAENWTVIRGGLLAADSSSNLAVLSFLGRVAGGE